MRLFWETVSSFLEFARRYATMPHPMIAHEPTARMMPVFFIFTGLPEASRLSLGEMESGFAPTAVAAAAESAFSVLVSIASVCRGASRRIPEYVD